ncbi:MAG: potassium channel family protein [Methanomassiliicoccales archaeon]
MDRLQRNILIGVGGLLSVILLGTFGYRLITQGQASYLDCAYMTIITIASVGFGEIFDLSHNPTGRVFTMVLIVIGAIGYLYFVSSFTAFVVEANLLNEFRRRKMEKQLANLEDHFILCGAGVTGLHIIGEFVSTQRTIVVIDNDSKQCQWLWDEKSSPYLYVLEGDASSDDVQVLAGVKRAHGLIACTGEDKDNLVITLTARHLNPNLRIISRCRDAKMIPKIVASGADSVISPNLIGGLRMASEMVRPTAVTFLDIMLRDRGKNLRVEEIKVGSANHLIGKTFSQINFRNIAGLEPIAVESKSGQWLYNPGPETKLESGTKLIIIGTPEQRLCLEKALNAG